MQLNNIECSLNYGKLLTREKLIIAYIGLGIFLLMPIISIGVVISALAGALSWDNDILAGLISGNAICIVLFSVLLFVIIRDWRIKRNIALWLEDAISLKAYAEKLAFTNTSSGSYSIQVVFKFNDKEYSRLSKPVNPIIENKKFFLKYDRKELNILYSPKFDQVLILNVV